MVFEVPQLPRAARPSASSRSRSPRRHSFRRENTANLVIPKDPPRDVKKYLNPSPLIEVTNAKVRSLARELTAGKETAWKQVQAILDGVRDKVKYERDSKNVFKGAIGGLRDGKADREDLTATFVAVCRAAKIPARMVWAMDYCYAEFYSEERGRATTTADDKGGDRRRSAKTRKRPRTKAQGGWYPASSMSNRALALAATSAQSSKRATTSKSPRTNRSSGSSRSF